MIAPHSPHPVVLHVLGVAAVSLLASAGLHQEACVACVMACGRVVSPLEAPWIRLIASAKPASATAAGGASSSKAPASVSGTGKASGLAVTAPPARPQTARAVLATSGVGASDDAPPTAFESPRRAVSRSVLAAHGNAAVRAPTGRTAVSGAATGGTSTSNGNGNGNGNSGNAGDDGKGGASGGDAIPVHSLLHSVALVADWRVNATLSTVFLPYLPAEHLLVAIRRRAQHALRCGDRVALAGSLAVGAQRLVALQYRRLRLECLRDATAKLAKLVAGLSPLRRCDVGDVLRVPSDVAALIMPLSEAERRAAASGKCGAYR